MAIALVLKTSAGDRLGVRIPHPPCFSVFALNRGLVRGSPRGARPRMRVGCLWLRLCNALSSPPSSLVSRALGSSGT